MRRPGVDAWFSEPDEVGSVPSVFPSFLASSVAAHDTESEPHQCSEHRHHDGVQPERPREAPPEEVDGDILPILDDEDDERCAANDGCDPAETETAIARGHWAFQSHVSPRIRDHVPTKRRPITDIVS